MGTLSKKGERLKGRSKSRKLAMKVQNSKPVIKNIDVEAIKESFKK